MAHNRTTGLNMETAVAVTGGDPALLKELAALFLQECPRLLSELSTAIEQSDAGKIEMEAHTIKGTTGHFGASAAFEAARVIEQKGRAGEFAGLREAYADLEEALAPLLSDLTALAEGS